MGRCRKTDVSRGVKRINEPSRDLNFSFINAIQKPIQRSSIVKDFDKLFVHNVWMT